MNITEVSNVDPSTAGEYIITYTITGEGFIDKILIRYVNVLEKDVEVIFILNRALTTYHIGETYYVSPCTATINGIIIDCEELSNNVDINVQGIYEIVYFVEVDEVQYTKIRYVFVIEPGVDLILHYRKEEEVLI